MTLKFNLQVSIIGSLIIWAPLAFANLVTSPAPNSPTVFTPGARSPTVFVPGQQSPTVFARPSSNNQVVSVQQHNKKKKHFNYRHRQFNNAYVYPYTVVTTLGPAPVNVDNEAVWVAAHNGEVPDNAIPYTDDNGQNDTDYSNDNSAYYCRAQYNNEVYDGVLVANEGCYVEDSANAATIRLENYDVLVNPN
jgi:hypothetical protein